MEILRLYPECKDYPWGGEKLKTKYGKLTALTPCAESWELSFHKDGLTRLADGKPLSECAGSLELGENAKSFPDFPMLIKLIDAREKLSVQVHPSDEYAMKHEGSYGKCEAWYILEAERGAGIYLGFAEDVTKEEYARAIAENRLEELLNFYEVKAGECYYIPSGTIHAIAEGCLICEIQQNSNITYRVYDWGRKDKRGNQRELHIEKALDVTSLQKYEPNVMRGEFLCASKYFTARRICVSSGECRMCANEKSFQCIVCISGVGTVGDLDAKAGESFFVPAGYGAYTIAGNMEIILAELCKYSIESRVDGSLVTVSLSDDRGRCVTRLSREKMAGNISAEFIADLCLQLLFSVNMRADDISEIKIDSEDTIHLKPEDIMNILNKKLA